jgi:hypothetical protein
MATVNDVLNHGVARAIRTPQHTDLVNARHPDRAWLHVAIEDFTKLID